MSEPVRTRVTAFDGRALVQRKDDVAPEAPLQIRLRAEGQTRDVSITMRTPGEDPDLALGFLFTEGIIEAMTDVAEVSASGDEVVVAVRDQAALDAIGARGAAMTSACGVCGKTSVDALRATPRWTLDVGPQVGTAALCALPEALQRAQAAFARTGGVHAAALADPRAGLLRIVREDVGRHNAVDKVVGALLARGELPAHDGVLIVSGRASFELVQKALMAGIPVLAAVGAPSSLAVDLAREAGMTLVGFLRGGRFNVYSRPERIIVA